MATPQMEMGNACQDTFIGSKSLSVNKSRVPSVKKVPKILKKFHHIQSTHVFHLRNWSWFALELVEIWDPKRPQLCHQPEALGRYHCFRPSRAAQSHWTGTHFHVSRRRGWMVFLEGWRSWEVTMTMTDVCRWFRWYPMFLGLHFRNRIGLTEALINSNKLLEVSRGWFWIWHYLWWKDLQNIQQPCQ